MREERLELSRLASPEPKGEASAQELAGASEIEELDAGTSTTEHAEDALAHNVAHPEEIALAEALLAATRAGQWDAVREITAELAARRLGQRGPED